MPFPGSDDARGADDPDAPAPGEPARGRFGAAGHADHGAWEPIERMPAEPAELASDGGRPEPAPPSRSWRVPVWAAVAAVMAIILGTGVVLLLGGVGRSAAPNPTPTVPTTTTGGRSTDGSTVPGTGATSAPTTTTDPWVPPSPPPDATVYQFPGRIEPRQLIIEFRGDTTVQLLTLANDGGGLATWFVGVQPGSGLEVNPAQGQLLPGESVQVSVLLDRENGRGVSDWAEDITVIGGGNSAPANVKVKIFEV